MDKQILVYPYNEILLNIKIIINIWNNMDGYQNNYAE